jgi:hypothetical protein
MRDLMRQAGALGPMIPRTEAAESTRAAIERADANARPVVQQIEGWARSLEGRMPSDIASMRREMGSVIPESERPNFRDQIAVVGRLLERAERTQGAGDTTSAQAREDARLALEGLGAVFRAARRAQEVGQPETVVAAARASFFDFAREGNAEQRQVFRQRGQQTLQLTDYLSEHRHTLQRDDMAEARQTLESWVAGMGRSATQTSGNAATDAQLARQQTQQVGLGFTSVQTLVNNVESASRTMTISAVRDYSDQMLAMAAQIRDQTFRDEIQRLREQMRQITERMEGDPAARISEAEMQKLETQIAFFINARDQILAGTEGPERVQLEAIIGRGLRAIREDHPDQAQVQLFIGGIYRDANSTLRGELRAVSEGLANGTMTIQQATQRVGAYYSRELTQIAGTGRGAIRDQESRDAIGRIVAGMSGRTLAVGDLARLAGTYEIAKDIRRHEDTYRNARGPQRQAADEALGIYRRALHAVEVGAPMGAANMQREFARRYMGADPAMRENIRGMSARLETAENIGAMQRRLGDSTDPAQIAAAARGVLGPNVAENDPRVAALVAAFNQAGSNAEERMMFVQGVETEANTFLQLMQRRDGIRGMLDQAVRQRLGERERQLYDRALGAIDGVLRSLGLGQQVSPTQLQTVQIQTIMLVGDPPLIQAAFATSRDPQERQAQLQGAEGLQSIQQVMGGIRDRTLRTQVAHVYGQGQEALAAGRVEEARAYFQLAQAAATTESAEDRTRIFNITNRINVTGEGMVSFTTEAASWFGRHFLDRAMMQARITDPAQQRTYNTYMDLALRMHIDGDDNGSMFMFNLASMFGRAAALGGNDPQVQAALALPQGNAQLGVPSLQDLIAEFMPYRVGVRGTLEAGRLFDELDPRRAPAEGPALRTFAQSLGAGESDSAVRLQRLALSLVPMQLGVDQAEFARGAVDPSARASAARYSAERRRLEQRLARATDPLERERLQREISLVDPTRLTERQQRASSDYGEGVMLMTQAAELRRQAIDKSAEAATTTDQGDRQRLEREARDLNRRADAIAQRSAILMQSASGLQGTVEGMHRSVTRVLYTNRREMGRLPLDSAARDYITASDEARRGEGPIQPGSMAVIGSRMQAAEQQRRLGLFQVAQQQQIQRQRGEMTQSLNRLHDQNVQARDRSTEPDEPPPGRTRQVTLPEPDREGAPVRGTTPAYDYDGIERRIQRARDQVGAENFTAAGRSMQGIGVVIQLYETRASVYRAYWNYLPGAGDVERATGSLHYLRATDLDSMLMGCVTDADAGRIDMARGGLWNVQEQFTVQSEQQRRWNFGVLIDNIAGGVERDQQIGDPGTQGYDPDNPRSFGYVPPEERARDPRRYQAHVRNMQAIAATGIFANLRRDRQGAAEDLRAAARSQRDSAAAIESSEDIITGGPGGMREGLGQALSDAAGRYDQSLRGQLAGIGGLDYYGSRVRGFVERGDTQGLMSYLRGNSRLADALITDLHGSGVLTDAAVTGMRADIAAGGAVASYQQRAAGWNYSTLAAGRVLEFWDTVDDTTRYRTVDHQMRDVMRLNGLALLGNARWASANPESVQGVIARGGRIPNVHSGSFTVENGGDSVYDRWGFHTEGQSLDLIGSWRDLARAQTDILMSEAQGAASVTIPELGNLRIPVTHRQARDVADRETRLIFMTMGFDVDGVRSSARRVELNQAQLEVVQEALQTVAQARGEFLSTGATLKSWITQEDRQRVYQQLADSTATTMQNVEEVVSGRAASGRDQRGNPVFLQSDRDARVTAITQTRTSMMSSIQQTRTAAAESERYWNYGCAAAELVGAGLVSLVPGGQIVVAGYFLTRGIEAFEEQRVGAGGWEQMTTTQQVLGVGGIALGALGFVSAGGSLITREAALGLQEGMALSRPILALSTATRVSGYTMILGGVGMAGLTMYDMYEQGQEAARRGERGPDWLDYGFQAFNAAQPFLMMGGQRIGMRYPSLMHSNSYGGYAFRGFMAVMGHSRTMAAEEAYIGSIEAMSRARHAIARSSPQALPHIEASLGRSLQPHEVLALQQHYTARGTDGRMGVSIPDPVSAAALLDGYSRHFDAQVATLSPDAHARLLTFQRELGFGSDAALSLIDRYGNGLMDVNTADVARYVNRSGAAAAREQTLAGRLNEEQRTRFGNLTHELETSMGRPIRLDERVALLERFGTSMPETAAAQSFLEGRRVLPADTVTSGPYDIRQYESTQYARDVAETAGRMNALARNEAVVVMNGVSEIRRGGDGSVTYVVGQGDQAVSATQQQISIAADTMHYAQRVAARPEQTPMSEWLPRVRQEIGGEIRAQLRAEGVPISQIDAVAEARTQAAVRLATDPQFREARRSSPAPGAPSPASRMLGRALAVSEPVVQAEGQRRTRPLERGRRAEVQGARVAARDETILRSQVIFSAFDSMRTNPQGQREFVRGTGDSATVYSQQHVSLATDFVQYGDRLVNRGTRSLTDVAAEVRTEIRQGLIRGGMDPTQADTVAAERSRAVLRLATNGDFRTAAQSGTASDRGVMMRIALESSREMVPQDARPRAAVPGQARPPPLPVTDEARAQFRGRRAEYQDLGEQGVVHDTREFRPTYNFEGRNFEVQEGQNAATAASAADLIVRRRMAGEDVSPARARQIAGDLGVPGNLIDRTVQLSENGAFVAAVTADSPSGRMRAALGITAPAEAPVAMPAAVRQGFDGARSAMRESLRVEQTDAGPVYHVDRSWTYRTEGGTQTRQYSIAFSGEHTQNATGAAAIADLVQRGTLRRDQIPSALREARLPPELEGTVTRLADSDSFRNADPASRARMALEEATPAQVQLEARRVQEAYRTGDAGTVAAVRRVLGSAPATDENVQRAANIVADQRVRQNSAVLGATGDGEFRTPQPDMIMGDGSRVSLGQTLIDRPRVRILDVVDNDTGSGGGVYLAEIIGPDGRARTIAVKVYRGPFEGSREQPRIDGVRRVAEDVAQRRASGETISRADIEQRLRDNGQETVQAGTIDRLASDPAFINGDEQARNRIAGQAWREREWGFNYEQRLLPESDSIGTINRLGLGIRGDGIVVVEGPDGTIHYGIGMEFVNARDAMDMNPEQFRQYVGPRTITQLREQLRRVVDSGYIIDDFQYGVVTDPTPGRQVGDVVIWDLGGLRRLNPGEDGQAWINRQVERIEFLSTWTPLSDGYLQPRTERARTDPAASRQLLEEGQYMVPFLENLTGTGPIGPNRERLPVTDGVEAGRRTSEGLRHLLNRRTDEQGRLAPTRVRDAIEEVRAINPQVADRIEQIVQRYEREAGLPAGTLVEPRGARQAQPAARAVGMDETTATMRPQRGDTTAPLTQAPRTRSPTAVVEQSSPESQYSGDPVAQAILSRGGRRGQEAQWLVGGERVQEGGEAVATGRILRTIEDFTLTMARGGQESDVITVSGDKRRLNQLNQMLGFENGDLALSAYRDIMHRAVTRASEEGLPFLIRPSQSGDEVIGVIITRPGEGAQVRQRLRAILEEETTAVFNERMNPDHPQSLAHVRDTVRNPRDLVSAAIEVGEPVQVRRQDDGSVTARNADGSDAMITRPDGTREFIPAMVRATDDPHFAPDLRRRMGVTPETEIRGGLEGLARERLRSAWERRNGTLSAEDREYVERIQGQMRIRNLDPARPQDVDAAINHAAGDIATLAPGVPIQQRSVAFEIRLEVTDPAVLGDIRGRLAETGKGLAEVLNNSFGLRGLNTFLGHYGANAVVNRVENAVAAYARERGIAVRRLGTMKYIIEGGTPEQVTALHQFISRQLQESGMGLRVSGRPQIAVIEPGATEATALSHVSNGHLTVDRRRDPQRASDWNGETQRYQDANALISAMAVGNDQALRTLLGGQYEAMRPVIDLVRSRADIRNFEDLVFALRDPTIGGRTGPGLEGSFRRVVVEEGGQFRERLEQVAPRPAAREAAAQPARVAVGAEGVEHVTTPARPRPGAGEGTTPARSRSPTPRVEVVEPPLESVRTDMALTPRVEVQVPPELRPRVEQVRHDVEGVSSDADAMARLRIAERNPQAAEVLDVIEGRLGLRGDISRSQGSDRQDAWAVANDPRAQVVELVFSDQRILEIMQRVDPVSRAEIVEQLVTRGIANPDEAIAHAYREIIRRRSSSPSDLISLASELSASPARQYLENGFRELGGNDLVQIIQMIAQEPRQAERERLAGWATTAISSADRARRVREAEQARSPAVLQEQERQLIQQHARARGIDPALAAELYQQGGTQGRIQVLEGFGVSMDRFALRQNEINGISDEVARRQEQREFDASVRGLFDLVMRGGLQEQISGMPGFEGAAITDVSPMRGLRGGYWVELSNGRHLFVKAEDLEPAQLGMHLARNQGMFASETHTADSQGRRLGYDTGLRVDGQPVRQEYGIIEDIREFAGTNQTITLPDGRRAQVRVEGVAMLREEVFRNPDMANPTTQEFYRQMATPEGRERIMQSWRAYQELSRRMGLMDRHVRNTAMAVVTTGSGERIITFQPIDMDGIGYRIGDMSGGANATRMFDIDFAEGTAGFLMFMSRRSSEVSADGQVRVVDRPQDMGVLYSEMFGETATRGARLPPDSQAVRDGRVRIFREHAEAGRGVGLGYDATAPDAGAGIGALLPMFGRERPVERADGRVTAIADDAQPVFDLLASGTDRFIHTVEDSSAQFLARKITAAASRIVRNGPVDRNAPEYPMAAEIAGRQEFRDLPPAQRERYIMDYLTERLQQSREIDIPIDVVEESPAPGGDRSRADRPGAIQRRQQEMATLEAQVGNRVDELIGGEIARRSLGPADQGPAIVLSQALTEAFAERDLTPSRIQELGLTESDHNFLRVLRASEMEPHEAAEEIARYSARQIFERRLDDELPGAVSTRAREANLNPAQEGAANVRALQLAEAFVDMEAGPLSQQRMSDLGIASSDRSFLTLLRDSEMSPHDVADEIARYAVEQSGGPPRGGGPRTPPRGPGGRGEEQGARPAPLRTREGGESGPGMRVVEGGARAQEGPRLSASDASSLRSQEMHTAAGLRRFVEDTIRLGAPDSDAVRTRLSSLPAQVRPIVERMVGAGPFRRATEGGTAQVLRNRMITEAAGRIEGMTAVAMEHPTPVVQRAPLQGPELGRSLRLDDPAQLASFARRIVRGDTDASAQLAQLPGPVQDQVGRLTGNSAFQIAARGSDSGFDSHVSRFGSREIRSAANEIGTHIRPREAAEQARPVAVGERLDVRGQPIRTGERQGEGPVGIAPEGPVAMGPPRGDAGQPIIQGRVSPSRDTGSGEGRRGAGPRIRREETPQARREVDETTADLTRWLRRRDEIQQSGRADHMSAWFEEVQARVDDPQLVEVINAAGELPLNHPRVRRLAEEYVAAREVSRRMDLADEATAQMHDDLLGDHVFHGERNPTLERVARMAADNPALNITQEQALARLREAYETNGIEGLYDELSSLYVRNESIDMLVLDARFQAVLADRGENSLLNRMAAARGRDPQQFRREVEETYRRDGVYGILDSVFGRQGDAAQSYANRMETAIDNPEFMDLLITGNVEGRIRALPGYENVTITGVEHLGGNAGAYRVELSDGRRIFIKEEGLETTQFGARLLAAQGMVDMSTRLHTVRYNTGAVDSEGRQVTREFGISEDIHGFAGQQVRIRTPAGQFEEVRIQSVAMMEGELFDPQAAQRILANPSDPRYQAVRAFTDLARTSEGRRQLAEAWSAYLELSRRALVIDRHPRNSAMMIGQAQDGRTVVTFQPIDTDFVAGGITRSTDPDAPFDMARYNGHTAAGFNTATAGYITGMYRLLQGLGVDVQPPDLAREVLSGYTAGRMPDPPEVRAQMATVIRDQDGRAFGLSNSSMPPGAINDLDAAGPRVIVGRNGQMIVHSDEFLAMSDYANSQPARRDALQSMRDYLVRRYNLDPSEVPPLPGAFPEPPPMVVRQAPVHPGPVAEEIPQITVRDPASPERSIGVAQRDLESRGATYEGTSAPDEVSRTFERFRVNLGRGVEVTIDMPSGLQGAEALAWLDRQITLRLEDAESRMDTGTIRPAVLERVRARGNVSDRVAGLAHEIDNYAGSSIPLDQIPSPYRRAVEEVRNARQRAQTADAETAAVDEVYRQTIRILDERDRQLAPGSSQGARDLFAITEGRLQRQPSEGETITVEMMESDPAFQRALLENNIEGMVAIAEQYARLASAADEAGAPQQIVEERLRGLRQAYDGNPQVRAALDREASERGLTPDQHLRQSAVRQAREQETRRIEFEASAQRVVVSRSIRTEGGRRVEEVTVGGRNSGLPERTYTGEQFSTATASIFDAERVMRNEIPIEQVPAERREAVRSLVQDENFVSITNGAEVTGDRRMQVAYVLERGRLDGLYRQYRTPSSRSGLPEFETQVLRIVDAEVRGGADPQVALTRATNMAFEARRLSSLRESQAQTPADTLYVRVIDRQARSGSREVAALRVVREIAADIQNLEAGGTARPADPFMALAHDMAYASASGRSDRVPTREDLEYGALISRNMRINEGGITPSRLNTVLGAREDSRGRPVLAVRIDGRDGSSFFGVHVGEDGAQVFGASAEMAVGSRRWPNDAMLAAFNRHMNARFGEQLAHAFRVVSEQMRRGNFGEARRIMNTMTVIPGVPRGRAAPAPPAEARILAPSAIATRLVTNGITSDPAGRQAVRSFMRLERTEQDHVISQLHASGRHEEATFLNEARLLSGRTGLALEAAYGLEPGSLSGFYMAEVETTRPNTRARLRAARRNIADRLGIDLAPFWWRNVPLAERNSTYADYISPSYRTFDSLLDDGFIFGMITSGDMIGAVREMYPEGVISNIEFRNGLVGAYEVRIVDTAGQEHTLYIKRQDLRPDRAGSEYSNASGVPAPEIVISRRSGAQLEYLTPDGSTSRFGILRAMGEFDGQLRMAGRDLHVRAIAESGIGDIIDDPQMLQIFRSDPQRFWEEFGFAMTGSFATGIFDRHEINVRAVVLEIVNPTRQDLDALRAAGHRVVRDSSGRYTVFRIGGIDTDSGGSFLVAADAAGRYDFTQMVDRFGRTDLHRLFVRMTNIRNLMEQADATAQGRPARTFRVESTIAQAFGTASAPGPFQAGMQRWMREFGASQGYRQDMVRRFTSHGGETAGMGQSLHDSPDLLSQLLSSGMTYFAQGFNGEPLTPVQFRDGRSVLRPDYEGVITTSWPDTVVGMFPHGREVYLVPLEGLDAGTVDRIRTGGVGTFNMPGRSQVAVFTSPDQIPGTVSRTRVIPVTRHDHMIRGPAGFGAQTGLPAMRLGPVPIFEQLMAAGDAYMGVLMQNVGQRILDREGELASGYAGLGADDQQRFREARGYR